ncbi:unnamed protein product [Allacma fusca]|uniref:PNPLA domain-containing protein n=1 Tax=Allacma fusca TaxID=39272 RepID=A0A8J2JQ57_9HEXA|nr:unnamed protein product [Allacma fusca]
MANKTKFNLSFAGCGFLGIYHVGVAACLKKYAPHLVVNKASGASAGAIAACCLLCDAPLGQITQDVLRIATLARSKTLGPFSPSFNINKILRDGLVKILPEDAHLRVNGKLHISLTRVHDLQNVIVSQFDTREELIEAIITSTFIPIFSGLVPMKYRGTRYVDGGFTDNCPSIDENTVTVNPFCGESDICPVDETSHFFSAILCSGFVPIFSGWVPPKCQGVRCMDGCYSDNLPILDENTITVSPFCGESDICPRDKTVNLLQVNLSNTSIELSRQNLYRFSRTLFPPKPEILSKMCQQGFDDTLRFLARNDLICCTNCMDPKVSSLDEELEVMAAKNYDKIMSEESCHQCKVQKQAALLDSLPDTVVTILQDAIESGNKGVLNWLFSHQSVRLLTLMSIPCLLPADMAYATILKVFENAPKLKYNLKTLSAAVIQLLAQTLSKFHFSPTYSAQLTCQLAFTEYNAGFDDDAENPEKILQRKPSIRNKVNFGFTLNIENRDSVFTAPNTRTNSRRPSLVDIEEIEDDTFERYLTVTSHQEAIMAYYYLNQDSEISEIVNMTDSPQTCLALPSSTMVEV